MALRVLSPAPFEMHRRVIPKLTADFGRLAGLIDGELSSQEANQAVSIGPALPTLDEPKPTIRPVQPAPKRGDGLLPHGGRLAGMPAQHHGEGLPDAPDLPDEADSEHDADQLRWQQLASRLAAWRGQMLPGPFATEDVVAAPEGADLDAVLLFAGQEARRYLPGGVSPKVHRRVTPRLTADFGRLAGLIDGELSSQEANQAVPVGPALPTLDEPKPTTGPVQPAPRWASTDLDRAAAPARLAGPAPPATASSRAGLPRPRTPRPHDRPTLHLVNPRL